MAVDITQIKMNYQAPNGEIPAIDSITLRVEDGEFVSVVGPSGCGKSTLLSLIAGLETPSAGSVRIDGQPVAGTSGKIGYMLQKDHLFDWRTILGNVTLGLEVRRTKTKENIEYVKTLLEQYGLLEFAEKYPRQLSGGMRQRCALIRTLATRPEILLLDEPFSALDYQTRLAVAADIHAILKREHKTAIMVTHDISESISMSDRIVVLTARPARIRSVYDLSELSGIPPMERRDAPGFRKFFNAIWKELDVHV